MDQASEHGARSVWGRVSCKGLLAITLWGSSFVFTRTALQSFTPFGLVAARLVMGTLLLLAMLRAGGQPLLPRRAEGPAYLVLGFTLSVHLLIQAYGLQYTSAIHTGWIIGFMPVAIVLGAHLLGQQRIRRLGWWGVVLGTGGVMIVTLSSSPDFRQARWGDLLQVSSCLTWTVYTLAATAPAARAGALRVTTLPMGLAALVVVTATFHTGVLRGALSWKVLLAMGFLGFLCNGLAYYLWFQALTEQGPARVSALLYLEPFVTLGAAATLLHERVAAGVVLGGVCVLAGVWLVAKGSAHPRTAPAGSSYD